MMTLTLCLATLAQPPAENESDRIREEIKAKWGVLLKDPHIRKELRITQTVYHSGKLDFAAKSARALQKMNDEKKGTATSDTSLQYNNQPTKIKNVINLVIDQDRIQIEINGQYRDSLTGQIQVQQQVELVDNSIISRFQFYEKQSSVLTRDKETERPVLAFCNFLERTTACFLFGIDHKVTRYNPIPINSLEFSNGRNGPIGIRQKGKKSQERYVFSINENFGIKEGEYTSEDLTVKYLIEYASFHGYLLPKLWSVQFFEESQLIQRRDFELTSFRIGEEASQIKRIELPSDTIVIDRHANGERYSRVLSDKSIVDIERSDRSKPLKEIEDRFQEYSILKKLSIIFIAIGFIGLFFTYFMRYRIKR